MLVGRPHPVSPREPNKRELSLLMGTVKRTACVMPLPDVAAGFVLGDGALKNRRSPIWNIATSSTSAKMAYSNLVLAVCAPGAESAEVCGCIPVGASSKAQASINAMGKQINSSTTIKLVVQAGNCRAGTTLSATWISTQATTA